MINTKKIVILAAIIAVPLILSACKTTQSTQVNTQSSETTENNQDASNAELGATVIYSDSGFTPSEVTVKVGQKVDVTNNSSGVVQFNSDPHPTHTTFPILNINNISPGETKSIVFDKAGTYKYHNHLNASERGTIVVE